MSEIERCHMGLFSITLEETKAIGQSSRGWDWDSEYRETFRQSSLILAWDCRVSCHRTCAHKQRLSNSLGTEVGKEVWGHQIGVGRAFKKWKDSIIRCSSGFALALPLPQLCTLCVPPEAFINNSNNDSSYFPSAWPHLSHLIPTMTLRGGYYYLSF